MSHKKELLLGFFALFYGFLLFLSLTTSFVNSDESWRFFYYFTNQSNIMGLLWLGLFGVFTFKKHSKFKSFLQNKTLLLSITVYLSITYFIVIFVLSPFYKGTYEPLSSITELFHHNLTTFVMWFMFFAIPGTGIKPSFIRTLLVLIYPFVYMITTLIIGANITFKDGSPAYPYGFINPNTYNNNCFLFIVIISALIGIFYSLSLLFVKLKEKFNTHINEVD